MLDPYHKPMESVGECDHANDHIADIEAKLAAAEAQVERLSEQFKVAFRLYLQDADYDLGELLEAEGAEYVDRKQEP